MKRQCGRYEGIRIESNPSSTFPKPSTLYVRLRLGYGVLLLHVFRAILLRELGLELLSVFGFWRGAGLGLGFGGLWFLFFLGFGV